MINYDFPNCTQLFEKIMEITWFVSLALASYSFSIISFYFHNIFVFNIFCSHSNDKIWNITGRCNWCTICSNIWKPLFEAKWDYRWVIAFIFYFKTFTWTISKNFFSVAYAGVVNTANPASTPAPPPYFPLRSSTLPPGKDNLPKLLNNLAVHRYY